MTPLIDISIYIDEREYASRRWPAVPRRNEEVMVCRVENREVIDAHAIAIVDDVCWGTSLESRNGFAGELRVSLFCHWRNAAENGGS